MLAEQSTDRRKENAMDKQNEKDRSNETHTAARPMRYVKDEDGNGWLCDKDIDPGGDLEAQGCWRCDEMAFPMGGR
jgi:hypothetical protein